MHVDIVPNRSSRPAILLREAWREGGKIRKRTIANLTGVVTEEQALVLRRLLKGETLVAPEDAFTVSRSLPHGHVLAVLTAMKRLGIEDLLASRPCKERSVVAALVAFRVLYPVSKLATVRAWNDTTLAGEFGVTGVDEHAVYHAMDWLVARQARIEKKLAARHLLDGARVMFDLSSTYVEGEKCELAKFGYSRDKKRGKRQINFGLLTDSAGRPISISVFPGNTSDAKTLLPQVEVLKKQFGLTSFTLVGDRGMITGKHLDSLRAAGVDWVTALKSQSLKKLVVEGVIQPSLFDEENLAAFTHPDYPGERLIACRNPVLGRQRAHARTELIAVTSKELQKIRDRVNAGKLRGRDKIGLKVGVKLGKYGVGKHFVLSIEDESFSFKVDRESVTAEASMDGIYVIRTSVDEHELTDYDAVRAYKALSEAERDFRCIKTDLEVRPIHHHLTDRVKAHLFICMLARYVTWHMERAWASLTFRDEETTVKADRDPVAPAARSLAAATKAQTSTLPDGSPTLSFRGLLQHLATMSLNICTHPGTGVTFPMITSPTKTQQEALDLLKGISV